ncbi:MAG: RHS repeat-associated core domain-containing protein, partial [Coriobacteriia bacterium]|nr:RHS repeat-associated core domain-containing protein [Coriobacteriia bacterium]
TGTTAQNRFARVQPLRYAGYCYDGGTGLYYLSARYYDPATYQFLSKDPAKDDGEESAYQYCGGDPVGKVDPTGLRDLWIYTFSNPQWVAFVVSGFGIARIVKYITTAAGLAGWTERIAGGAIKRGLTGMRKWFYTNVHNRLKGNAKMSGVNKIAIWSSERGYLWASYRYSNPRDSRFRYNFRIAYLGMYQQNPIFPLLRKSRYWVG